MTARSATHGVFSLERVYDASPARVFAAFATEEGKARWFGGGDDWTPLERVFEFRIGGQERAVGRWKSGTVTRFDARYFDSVPDARVVIRL